MLIFPGSKCLHQTNCTLEDNWTLATHHTLHGFSTFFVLLGGWALGGSSHDGRKWWIPMVIVFALLFLKVDGTPSKLAEIYGFINGG